MPDSTQSSERPPYLSFVTFVNFVGQLTEGSLPSRIDKTVMGKQSGANQSYLLSALRFFGLVDSADAPSVALRELTAAWSDAVRVKQVWRHLIERAYAQTISGFDLSSVTTAQFNERVTELYGFTGETLRKCHSFFLAAYGHAGIELGAHLKVVARVPGVKRKPKPVSVVAPAPVPAAPIQLPPAEQLATMAAAAGEDLAILKLDASGKRVIRLLGPAVVTKEELSRIQQWLSFHFIVSSDAPAE